jgi:hypothetical protein
MKKLSILFTAFILSSQAFSQLTYSWVKTIGLSQQISGIESSSSGNVFIMGKFNATTDFDPSSASFFLTPNVTTSCFLAKYTSTGSFIWAKEIISEINIASATSDLDVSDIVIDASENVYITGTYDHIVDFDPTATTYTLSTINAFSTASVYAFTVKYSSSGSLIWVKDIRRPSDGTKIALDNSNNVYVGAQVSQRPFFCKYNNAGSMIWKDSLITTGLSHLSSMHVNGAGEVFVGGSFNTDIDMDPNVGVNLLSASQALFIGKYTTAGIFIWAKKIVYSTLISSINDITEDALGNVYTCGLGSVGGDIRNQITKWDINGNLQWNNFFNTAVNSNFEGCYDIFVACNNQIIVTGKITSCLFSPQNFDPLGGVYPVGASSNANSICRHSFVAAYSPSNGGILWAKIVGGDGNITFTNATSISHIDNAGSIYISGNTMGLGIINDFDPGSGIVSVNIPSSTANVFFAKYTGCGAVGIEENNDANTISVSPNPSNNKFFFSNLIGDNKIEVIDITGRLILTDYLKYSSYTLSMDDLPKGMYFYKITDAKGQLNQGKLILQ